jgi:hypothetical protein
MSTAWAFRYGRDAKGVEAHADYSIYTVNLWITDETSNKDPSTGGMFFYDVEADNSRDFHEYNAEPEAINKMIGESAVRRRASYKGNRAVIFRSSIFHASEDIAFRDGFVNHRVNLTLGFGYR